MIPIVLAMLMVTAAPAFEVQTLDGQTHDGVLTELASDRLTLETSQGPVTLETEKVTSVSLKQKKSSIAKPTGSFVEMVDGSTVFVQQYTSDAERAKLVLSDGQTVEMPVRNVLTVRLDRDSDTLAGEWTRLIGGKHDADLLVIRKDDALDYHKGVLHDVTEEMVRFDVDGEVLPVKRAKIYGFAYQHRVEGELPPLRCRITDASGSQWSAHSLALSDKLQWTTLAGVEVSMPLEQIAQIDYSAGKILYLSDIVPENVRWTPFFGGGKSLPFVEQFYSPKHDSNFVADPLQLAGVEYRKGLAVRSRTELTYRMPKDFNRFLAIAGIDDDVRPNGKVRLVVRGDAKILLETTVTGNDPPTPIDLDVAGIRKLTILVDFSDTANVGDHLLLCNARVTK